MFPQPLYRPAADVPSMRMTAEVYQWIQETVGTQPSETGGILGGSLDDFVVRRFAFDEFADTSGGTYSPNCEFLNWLLGERWNPRQIRMLGFVHSHPRGARQPSRGDLIYAARIMEANPALPQLLLPIAMSADEGPFGLFSYRAVRQENAVYIEQMRLEIIDDEPVKRTSAQGITADRGAIDGTRCAADSGEGADAAESPPASNGRERKDAGGAAAFHAAGGTMSLEGTFCRVREAFDLKRMAACRVVAVGVGGGRELIVNLARAGVGEFVLIDPDIVSESNLATQHVYRRELGRHKVDCVAERILDINPTATVRTFPVKLDALDDDAVASLVRAPVTARRAMNQENDRGGAAVSPPAACLLCGFTDDFFTQARTNRLGLKLGLPTLCAQVYARGAGAEITFTFPGVTPACHRCMLRTRYEAYLDRAYRNDVTSDGTPIFATSRLNALKGFVAMALLHHGTDHPRWGGLLERIGNRNLVQIRMSPDVELPVFDRVFGGADQQRILFDEAVWLPQKPDHPQSNGLPSCPDCGGSGDLRDKIGHIADTR